MRDVLLQIEELARSAGPQAALDRTVALIEAQPAFELWVTAAGLALRLGRLDIAQPWLRQAHAARPAFLPVRRQLSQVLNRLAITDQRAAPAELISLLQQALQLWPENAAARYNLAAAQLDAQPAQALELARELLQLDPADAAAAALLARAAAACGDASALLAAVPALLQGDQPDLLRRSAEQLAWNTHSGGAQPVQHALLAAHPDNVLATLGLQLALPACYADRAELAQTRAHVARALADLPALLPPTSLSRRGCTLEQLSWSNFLLAYQGGNDRDLQAQYGHWLSAAAGAVFTDSDPRARARRPGRRRIGLLSSFWRECTVGAYFGAWIGALRSADTEVTLLTLGHACDDWTTRLETHADHALRLPEALADAARQVAALDLDLLIYPELGMHGATLVLAALRLARRQWCGWGHPVSSGLPTIDRQISVAPMEPADAAEHYSEPLLLLPDLGTTYPSPQRPPAVNRADLGLAADRLLLVLPSSAFKLHPDGDAELARLLAERPAAQAVLLATEPAGAMNRLRTRLHGALRETGANPEAQLRWLPALPRQRFLQLLSCCDLLLDPWHWSGGNTTLDALHAGLPILARWGEFMRGRQSAAMLQVLDLPGVADHRELLDHPDARQRWRSQAGERLPQLLDGRRALVQLREAVLEELGQ